MLKFDLAILPEKLSAVFYLKKGLDEVNRMLQEPNLRSPSNMNEWRAQRDKDMIHRHQVRSSTYMFVA